MSEQYMKPEYNRHHTISNQLENLFSFPHTQTAIIYLVWNGKLVGKLIMYQVKIIIPFMLFSGIFNTNQSL